MPLIRSIEFLAQAPGSSTSGSAEIRVHLEDGSSSRFGVLTPNCVMTRMNGEGKDFFFGPPVLFAKSLDPKSLGRAVEKMAAHMSGFWLRYYNSKPAAKGRRKVAVKKPHVDAVEIAEPEPVQSPGHCSAVVQVSLSDGRQFSMLAATPSWFSEAFEKMGLECYFGPCVLFVRSMDPAVVRRCVMEMVQGGDQWLCRYDTPRTALPRVLADFQARHP